ncbi:Na+/Pi-cotransporter [Pseudovibrio axinellae]|uniref:Na+/Pi-cotransporter n=1 Tax=Pseudovibrio axinellae TaxID=989403 RepID=A0A165T5P0_9HYPH|nr:Na+/Pi-cotransporter [Pseudovibrio axinellae]SEP97909.1 solute carrier family 34 (sodium-dependent phosphate cotransporter) [Pseudovibrio axinellae]
MQKDSLNNDEPFHDDEHHMPLGIRVLNWISVGFLIYFLLCAVGLIEAGFLAVGQKTAEQIFSYATNPIAGVFVGILTTSLVQSSSVTTSILVGLVAAGLPISIAVPIVIGANFGTTLTNTFVSLGYARDRSDFKRAFSAATVHDAFNLICLLIFLPLEIAFGFLQKIAVFVGELLSAFAPTDRILTANFNFINALTDPLIEEIKALASGLMQPWNGLMVAAIGFVMLIVSITFVSQLLKLLLANHARRLTEKMSTAAPSSGIITGLFATLLLQSSSATTSLLVPLAGSGVLTTKQVYPFTLGANVGTCLTAILAAFAVTGQRELAFEIAIVHLVYNLLGVLLIYSLPFLRYLPVQLAEYVGDLGSRRFVVATTYVIGIFFLVPALGIFLLSR